MNHFPSLNFQSNTAICKYVAENTQKYDTWTCGYRNTLILLSFFEIPSSIEELQIILEQMWNDGFDPDGKQQLFPVVGTRKWIGPTEVYLILLYFQIESTIVDMPSILKFDQLIDKICTEFLFSLADPLLVVDTPPIFFQYEGHSNLIVGVDECGLYILDSIAGPKYLECSQLRNQHEQYQILIVKGHLMKIPSKTITSIRL